MLLKTLVLMMFSSCLPQVDLSDVGSNIDDEQKANDVTKSLRKGELAQGFNRLTDPPDCPDCATKTRRTRRKIRSGVKVHQIAEVADMSCLKTHRKASLSKVRIRGANSKEKEYIAKMAGTFYQMGGQKLVDSMLGVLNYNFVTSLRKRRDGNCLPGHRLIANTVTIARQCPGQSGAIPYRGGFIVHETGHFVGGSANRYGRYNSAVRLKCTISGYCSHSAAGRAHRNRNEEFAEVFAAYLTAPTYLKDKCKAAYDFMNKQVFNNANHSCR